MVTYLVTVGEREYRVTVGPDGGIGVEGYRCRIGIQRIDNTAYSVLINNESILTATSRKGHQYQLLSNGVYLEGRVETARERLLQKYATSIASTGRRLEVHAPMPALVVRVMVKVGEEVMAGQGLLILEAMKMENELKSHQTGTVKEVLVVEGKPVEKGELLILLE